MQSRKASNSKKTSKGTNEAVISEKKVAAEVTTTTKPRASRSSKSKKEVAEVSSAKSHRKSALGASSIPASESSLVANTLPETPEIPKAMSATAGFESTHHDAAVIDPVGVVVAPAVDTKTAFASAPEVSTTHHHSREEIAHLAYSYWIARGYRHGSADEDWLRAEVELARKR